MTTRMSMTMTKKRKKILRKTIMMFAFIKKIIDVQGKGQDKDYKMSAAMMMRYGWECLKNS